MPCPYVHIQIAAASPRPMWSAAFSRRRYGDGEGGLRYDGNDRDRSGRG